MSDGVVIIGAGHGGVQAAASLREEGYEGRIALIGDEAELPYHKPPLSKTFIKNSAAQPQILRADAFYSGARIEMMLGQTVEAIDPVSRRIRLAGGTSIGFDRAILATGSRPRLLRFEGAPPEGLLSLRSVTDARAIRDAAATVEDVVVIGGGFIGLEIAATLRAGGIKVTVVEAQDRLLARAVAPAVAEHVRQRLVTSGVRVALSTTIGRIEAEGGRVTAVLTSGGERIPAGMVIVGIGVAPNDELASAAGIATQNGIRVDALMRSSVPEILAIGDVANYRHWLTGQDVRLESVQNATDQAKAAAKTIIGHAQDYGAVPWFWSDIGDMKLQMVGLTGGGDRQVAVGDPAENRFSLFHYRDGKLLGIESVNRPADHMLGRRMMAEGFSPSEAQAAGDLKAAFEAWRASNQQKAG